MMMSAIVRTGISVPPSATAPMAGTSLETMRLVMSSMRTVWRVKVCVCVCVCECVCVSVYMRVRV